jgi:Fe-S-cluster-containing hydrogenase component 2
MDERRAYAALRRHLDGLPVGFPKSRAGGRILRRLFSPAEARVALGLSWEWRSPAEAAAALAARGLDGEALAREAGIEGGLEAMLKAMASKGSLLMRASEGSFALMPFVVGMYELQIARLSKDLVRDTAAFMYEGFGLELLASGEAQTRVIPIGAAIRPEHRIADYDETEALIRGAGGRIAVLDCVCRKAADLAGKPCAVTERRELCMVFRDFADTVTREGWGRAVSEAEALELAALNQREGLVMRPSNEREPQFICACCGDCCGLLAVAKAMKRPADFVATNHRAAVDAEACVGCGACARICPMEAVAMDGPAVRPAPRPAERGAGARQSRAGADKSAARVIEGRCIGCGVCVAACKFGAMGLQALTPALVPPKDTQELLGRLAARRPGLLKKLGVGLKGILGLRAYPHGRRR